MKRFISLLLVVLLFLSTMPTYAATPQQKPVITQIGTSIVTAANVAQFPNRVYLPLAISPKCYNLTPLQPGAAAVQCASLSDYTGAQSLAGYVTTLNNSTPFVFSTDLPSHAVTVPQQTIHIGPVDQTPVSTLKVKINAMAFVTETDTMAASVDAANPMMARALWVLKNAVQGENASNPKLFPVSILAMHYSQPIDGADRTNPFAICGQTVGLYIYGYPVDATVSDATATSGNLWLKMKYPSCPGMAAYPYLRLSNFWNTLKTFPQWQNIDKDAGAAPTTYHATIQVSDAFGHISPVDAVIVVGVVGAVVLIAIFPPSGVGWWFLVGTAVL